MSVLRHTHNNQVRATFGTRYSGLFTIVGLRGGAILAGADCGEPVLGDAQRERSLAVIAPPDRQGALRRNFFDQVLAQQLAEHLDSTVPSSRCAAAESGTNWVSVIMGSSIRGATASRAVTTEAPQWP